MRYLITTGLLVALLLTIPHGVSATPNYVVLTDAHGFVYVDVGSDQGVRPGMHFDVLREDSTIARIAIQAVDGQVGRATIVSGDMAQPGDQIALVPSAQSIAVASEPLPVSDPAEPQEGRVSWLSAASLLSFAGALGSFYAAHQASQNYATAGSVADVQHYAPQRDRYQSMSWMAVGTGTLIVGVRWLVSKL